MAMIRIEKESADPIYRQIVDGISRYSAESESHVGEMIPSMNALASQYGISRETVKKAYSILVERGIVEPRQGRGFFIAPRTELGKLNILVLFDKLSAYKQILLNSMCERLGKESQVTIRLHNQSVELLEYYLDVALDRYDFYIVAPHFPLDDLTGERVLHELKRIPNRKLIVVDRWMESLPGRYGAVYQDFGHDICDGLGEGLDSLRRFGRLCVITTPSSLYHREISDAVAGFCAANGIGVEFHNSADDGMVEAGRVFLLLNSQLDSALLDLVRAVRRRNLDIGTDVGIISYNDSPINELVAGGLTTVSADFAEMGRMAAEMILGHSMLKVRCPFRMTRRKTF